MKLNENLEIFSLIWLEKSPNDRTDSLDLHQQLRTIIHSLKIFEEIDRCEEYLRSCGKFDRIILLVNEQFAREILQRTHQLRQLIAVYIHANNDDQTLRKDFQKVRYFSADLFHLSIISFL